MNYLFLLFLALFIAKPVAAVTTPPTASPSAAITSATSSAEPTSEINLEEIQKIRQAVQEKVKEKLNQIVNTSAEKKAWVGTITALSDSSITLTVHDQERSVTYDDSTVFIDTSRVKSTSSKLKVGQTIIAMGYPDSDSSLPAKRIVIAAASDVPDTKTIVVGKITDLSTSSSTIVITPLANKDYQYEITLTSKTPLFDFAKNKLTTKDLKTGQIVSAVLSANANKKSFSATALFVTVK